MDLQEKNKVMKQDLIDLDNQEKELKNRIAEFKQLISEKDRKQKKVAELQLEEQELLKLLYKD